VVRTIRSLAPAVVLSLVLLAADRASAQTVIVAPPRVSYYVPPPAVPCYSPPVVATPVPTVTYYYAPPAVTTYYPPPAVAYPAPAVSYYAPPAAVTTTRYGLFGRPRYSVTRYYP
jgi:hypothetical protein